MTRSLMLLFSGIARRIWLARRRIFTFLQDHYLKGDAAVLISLQQEGPLIDVQDAMAALKVRACDTADEALNIIVTLGLNRVERHYANLNRPAATVYRIVALSGIPIFAV
jgi:hypothetical protein